MKSNTVIATNTQQGPVADPESYMAKVMMVDDESITTRLLRAFLEDVGYSRFVTTNRSPEAMEMLLEERPDVLLLDLQMPVVDGFQILSEIRQHPDLKHMPVLILTASDGAACKLKALELGATDFLAKPVDSSELALRLRNTLSAKAYQDRLRYYDALTNLPNRRAFVDRLSDCLAQARQSRQPGALLHINLDRFHHLNESLGYSAADRLLRIVAERIEHCVRETDEVCETGADKLHAGTSRFGGDEFMVLLPGVDKRQDVPAIADRILRAVAAPIPLDNRQLVVTPSVGILQFEAQPVTVQEVLRRVSLATARAKQLGRNRFEFYSGSCEAGESQHLDFEADLHQALDRDELRIHLQPKVSVATGQVKGAEALLRWEHATRGMVGPDKFIPLAEESGLIVQFGSWVIHEACRQLAQWGMEGLGHLNIAVNVASLQLRSGGLQSVVRGALDAAGVDPARLTLELTESSVIDNARECIDTLNEIRALGVRLSLDDFGTGYSSLSYLERLPIDELKIDRSFVSRIDDHGDEAPILRAVIAMARSLGLDVVAEGVENQAQLDYIRQHECDVYQGYFFARPLPAAEFQTTIRERMREAHRV